MAEEQKQEKLKRSAWKPVAILFIILTILLLVGLAAVLLFIPQGLMVQGNPNAGTGDGIPITVGSGSVEIYLTTEEDNSSLQTSLTVEGMNDQGATTLQNIPSDITHGLGDKSDRTGNSYFAYSFYIVNRSQHVVSYEITVNVLEATGNVLGAVRVMLIEGDAPLSAGTIYAKAESSASATEELEKATGYTTQPIESDKVICRQQSSGLGTKEKVTILIWLEGYDPDCSDDILACSVKMNLEVTGLF